LIVPMRSNSGGSLTDAGAGPARPCPGNADFPRPSGGGLAIRSMPVSAEIEAEIIHLINKYAGELTRYAAAMAHERTLAQDEVQEAFFRYFIARSGGQQIRNARAWLFRVLKNHLMDSRRKRGSIPAVDLKSAMDIEDEKQNLALDYEQDEKVRLALSSLSPRERECVRLRLMGFSYGEIAGILRIRPGTVASLLARGLDKIRHGQIASGKHAAGSPIKRNRGHSRKPKTN